MELLGSELRLVRGRISSWRAWQCSMQDGCVTIPIENHGKRNQTDNAQTSAIHYQCQLRLSNAVSLSVTQSRFRSVTP